MHACIHSQSGFKLTLKPPKYTNVQTLANKPALTTYNTLILNEKSLINSKCLSDFPFEVSLKAGLIKGFDSGFHFVLEFCP